MPVGLGGAFAASKAKLLLYYAAHRETNEELGIPIELGNAKIINCKPAAPRYELVFTPTNASFLNWIECHFWAIGEFVVNNADYRDWDTFKKAMADHIHYRNGPHRDQRLLNAERRLLIAA